MMKKHSLFLRALLLTLALVTVLGSVIACGTEAGKTPTNTKETGSKEAMTTSDPRYDADGYLKDTLPEDLNFNRVFKVLCGYEQRNHVGASDEMAGEVIGESIYSRNETVQDRLGIEIQWDIQRNFQGSDQTAFMQRLENDIKGSGEYDSVISYNLLPYSLAVKGYCKNLVEAEHIDLQSPWWPTAFLDSILYRDQLYALVSECSTGTLENMLAVFFNKQMLENYNIESPYDLVDNDEWTIAKLKELIQGTYQDLNTNGKADKMDQFGLCTSTNARLTSWYVGMGVKLITRDANGDLVLTAGDAKVGQAIDTVVDLFSTEDSFLVDTGNVESNFAMFMEQRAVFYVSAISLAAYNVRHNFDLNYGVVPLPKWNTEQDRYYTHIANNHPIWYIPSSARDVDCSSAFIECMASEAYRQIEPVYYDTCMKLRFAPDERLGVMYDLVRESITFDLNYVYRFVYSKDVDTYIRNCIAKPDVHKWSSTWAGIRSAVESNFQEIVTIYGERFAAMEQ